MSALRATALHLRIAEFKFTHNFRICNQLPETELIFDIDIQRKFSLMHVDFSFCLIFIKELNFL